MHRNGDGGRQNGGRQDRPAPLDDKNALDQQLLLLQDGIDACGECAESADQSSASVLDALPVYFDKTVMAVTGVGTELAAG